MSDFDRHLDKKCWAKMFLISKKDKKVENDDVSIIIKSSWSRLAKARGQLVNSNEGQFRVL